MNVVEIVRLEESEQGTFGVLKINKKVFCCTLEPRDEENQQNISSIPAQQYLCRLVESPTFGGTFEVTKVPSRSNILFHAGNVTENTEGCVLLGEYFGKLSGDRAILNSGKTFRRFLNELGRQPFHLTIQEYY